MKRAEMSITTTGSCFQPVTGAFVRMLAIKFFFFFVFIFPIDKRLKNVNISSVYYGILFWAFLNQTAISYLYT
jgi:hypothetical protein